MNYHNKLYIFYKFFTILNPFFNMISFYINRSQLEFLTLVNQFFVSIKGKSNVKLFPFSIEGNSERSTFIFLIQIE